MPAKVKMGNHPKFKAQKWTEKLLYTLSRCSNFQRCKLSVEHEIRIILRLG